MKPLAEENADKLRALRSAIDEGMADVAAGRVVPWNLKEFLEEARKQKIDKAK
jgi:predicted transcriptional regulator